MNTWRHRHGLERSARLRQTVVWAFVWAWAVCRATEPCPKVCECKWRDGKETVSCPHAEFIDIPRGLDPSTQVLDLKHNNLQILPRDAFVDTGLVNLQKVWLNHCNLKHMDRGAFNMLANLVELDLSHNLLRSVPSAALGDVPGLRELRLAFNALRTLSEAAFTPTPDLVRLDLSNNVIDAVSERAFRGLTRLEVLKLSGNNLTTLDADMVLPLVAIHELHLDGNPWHCDCRLRPLRHWMEDRNVAFSEPPACLLPGRLGGRSWQVLTLDEFVCVPTVVAVAPRVLAAHGENVSLSCRVETDADAAVTWLLGDRPLLNDSESQRYRVLELVVPSRETRLSNLTISGAAPRDEGTYRCVAYNKAGRVETNLTLQVSNEMAEVRLVTMDRVFVTGGLLSVVGVVLVVLLLLAAVVVRRRHRMCRRRDQQDVEQKNETPQTSQGRDSASSDSHPKLADYHIVPTNDLDDPSPLPAHSDKSWMLRDASVDDFPSTKDLEKPNVYGSAEGKRRLATAGQGGGVGGGVGGGGGSGRTGSPSTVSYVEIPKSEMSSSSVLHTVEDRLGWKDQPFNSKDSLLRQASGQTGSQLSMGSVGHYPDLLDLPYTQQQQQLKQQSQHPGSTAQLFSPAYCTIPRRCASWMNLSDSEVPTAPSQVRPNMRQQLSLPDATPIPNAHRHTLAHFMALHRGRLDGEGGAAGGDPCNLEYHAAQLEKFLLEYRSLQEQLYRMKESYEASHRTDSLPSDSNGDSEGDNVPPPCPEAPTPSPYPKAPPSPPLPPTTPGSEPIRSILKKRQEPSARGLPGLQGLLGLQSLQGLKGFQGLQELQDLEGPYPKSAFRGEDSSRLRPSKPDFPDDES